MKEMYREEADHKERPVNETEKGKRSDGRVDSYVDMRNNPEVLGL